MFAITVKMIVNASVPAAMTAVRILAISAKTRECIPPARTLKLCHSTVAAAKPHNSIKTLWKERKAGKSAPP